MYDYVWLVKFRKKHLEQNGFASNPHVLTVSSCVLCIMFLSNITPCALETTFTSMIAKHALSLCVHCSFTYKEHMLL